MITDRQIYDLLDNPHQASGNHYVSKCPYCNKDRHFYIKKNTTEIHRKTGKNKTGNWDCKRCGETGTLFKLLAKLNKLSLLKGRLIDVDKKLEKFLIDNKAFNIDLKTPNKKLPLGFKRSFKDDYFNFRGFDKIDYDKNVVGRTSSLFRFDNYVIISVTQNNECKGYLSRHVWSKDKLSKYEKETGFKFARYQNSKNTEFNKIVGGFDEINFLTETIILVEGFFDKVRVDKILKLHNQNEVKCCFTFGKDVSLEQQLILKSRGKISNIILIQDPDAVNNSKKVAFELQKFFDNVLVGFTKDKDLDECSEKEFFEVFDQLKKPLEYSINYLQTKSLR